MEPDALLFYLAFLNDSKVICLTTGFTRIGRGNVYLQVEKDMFTF